MGPATTGDDELLARAKAGDRGAFDTLYQRHFACAYAVAFRLCGGDRDMAADIAQDGFLALILRSDRYRYSGHVRAYLLRTVINAVRQRMRARAILARRLPGLIEPSSTPAPDAIAASLSQAAREALGQLPVDQRELVVLRVYEGLKFREMAEATGVPIDTVKTRYRRAIARLREVLAPWADEAEAAHD